MFVRIPKDFLFVEVELIQVILHPAECEGEKAGRQVGGDANGLIAFALGIVLEHDTDARVGAEAIRQFLTLRMHMGVVLNRRGLQTAMASIRQEELPVAVCLFDLDDPKKANDGRGHETGDKMIRAFADLLRRHTQEQDILCRYGGDEFMVVLKRLNDAEAALKKGTDICREFQSYLTAEQLPASCFGGIALCRANEKPSTALIERADRAMYRAKRENKGGCCLWQEP